MDSFSVQTTLTQTDWRALMAAAGVRLASTRQARTNLVTRSAPTVIWVMLVAAFAFMFTTEPPLIRPLGVLISIAAFFGVWWAQYRLQQRLYAPDEQGAFLGTSAFEFESRGFHARRSNSDSFNRWSLIKEVTHSDEHVFIWIDAFTAYVIPARDLPAPLTAPAVASRLREFMGAAAGEPGTESTAASAPAPVLPAAACASGEFSAAKRPPVMQEFGALLRLHTWAMVDRARLYGRDTTLLLLGIFSFVLWAGLDRLNYEGDVEVFWYTISESGVLVLAMLLLGWLMSRVSRPRIETRQSLLLLLAFLPVFVAGIWLAFQLPKIGAIVATVLLMAWADRFLVGGMRSLTGQRQQLAVSSVLAATLLLFYLSTQVYFSPGIWFEQDPDREATAAAMKENEQLVFEQSARLDAAISKLAPRDSSASAFFVGFAGYGGQRVFAEEIGLAERRFAARYGSGGRSLRLVNDRRDKTAHPMATAPALRHTLNAIARRMDPEDDVLFLSLSSHGSEDATISVSNELGYWRDLSATELADMLRESGIRWKVVVISACHSGSFIDALRDENSIILTAAAAERTSFGCSDDNDLTYFGEAFYRDALPKAASLREAFNEAREALEKRELSEARTPSDPQAHFGAALEKKLAAIEAASIAR